jgi:uncharacterized protein (TIGR03000 family)
MKTFTELLPTTKPGQHNTLTWTPGEAPGSGLLVVHTARSSCSYRVTEFERDFGCKFELAKDGMPGADATSAGCNLLVCRAGHCCTCKGFQFGKGGHSGGHHSSGHHGGFHTIHHTGHFHHSSSYGYGGYYYPSYSYSYPSHCYSYPNSYYTLPSGIVPAGGVYLVDPAPSAVATPATVTVIVPEGAQVWFDGKDAAGTGTDRVFTSSILQPNQPGVLSVKASWGGNTYSMQLTIRAGDKLRVDLR